MRVYRSQSASGQSLASGFCLRWASGSPEALGGQTHFVRVKRAHVQHEVGSAIRRDQDILVFVGMSQLPDVQIEELGLHRLQKSPF